MNRFTLRSALVLAVVLLLGGATTSFAQVIFGASAGNPQVRVGGMTETVGDAALTSTNGTVAGISFPAGSGSATITLTYSSTITNKTTTGATATCTMGLVANVPVACAPLAMGPSVGGTAGILVTVSNVTINDAVAASTKLNVSWTAAGNTLTIQFAPTAATVAIYFNSSGTTVGGGLAASIAIHGVRINAAGMGIPPTLPTVSAFLNTNPSANIQLAAGSTSLTVGTLTNALGSAVKLSGSTNTSDLFYTVPAAACSNFGATPCTAPAVIVVSAKILPRASYDNCAVQPIPQGASAGSSILITGKESTIDRDGDPNFGVDGAKNTLGIKIVEAYPGAFTSKADEGAKSNAAEVDNGTRIRIDFSGLPSQLVVASPERISTTYSPTALTGMSLGTIGLVMDLVSNYQNCVVGAGCTEKPNSAIADVRSASGGAVTFEYEVAANSANGAYVGTPALTASPGVASAIIIPFFLFRTSTPVDLGTINIAVTLGPRMGSTVVRFSDQLTASTATVEIKSCTTELFYPFVTNTAGFDTGIYVLNGGQARGGNNGQSGACAARFFDGSTTGTTAVKTSTLPILGPGQSFSFTASDATLGKPGFGNGYVQVTCPFQAAHGAAYVTFGFGTAAVGSAPPGTLYLALIGDSRDSRNNR
jgi:hypothetical protein